MKGMKRGVLTNFRAFLNFFSFTRTFELTEPLTNMKGGFYVFRIKKAI